MDANQFWDRCIGFKGSLGPQKHTTIKKRKGSKAVNLHDGAPWRTLLCPGNDLRARK